MVVNILTVSLPEFHVIFLVLVEHILKLLLKMRFLENLHV